MGLSVALDELTSHRPLRCQPRGERMASHMIEFTAILPSVRSAMFSVDSWLDVFA